MRRKVLTQRHLVTPILEVQEIVAATRTTVATRIKRDIIPVTMVGVGAVDIDEADNTMPVEVVTLVAETDQLRYVRMLMYVLKKDTILHVSSILGTVIANNTTCEVDACLFETKQLIL